MQALLHALANAVDVLQFEAEQNVRQVVFSDDNEPVRFLQVGPDLAEKHIGRDADRTGEAFAKLLAQGLFDFERKLARNRYLPLGAHQTAGHFIDRANFLDRHAGVDRSQDALVIIGVEAMIGLHRDDVGVQLTRLAYQGAGLDAECLGRVAGGDRDRGIRRRLHDDDWLAAGWVFLLFARRKKGVEIEEQPLHRDIGR
jgi:hypothetical protein